MEQIRFDTVELAFENNLVVESFDLSIAKGEIVSLFGPSGCGKSSLMKMVLGINSPSKGSVTIGSVHASAYRYPISYVPQENELLPWLSVAENIEIWSKNSSNKRLSTSEVLDMVDMKNHSHKLPKVLSGGMLRRAALARGLATNSEIFCFDEAMVGIEKSLRKKLLVNLRDYIKINNATAIFISHDYEEAIFLSDRIVVLTPPSTVILKQIDVNSIIGEATRDENLISSDVFRDVYYQMLNV